ncbi:MAG TPA: hypothetical protein VI566_16100 [Xanthomonadales bacterium]|nr:hypothetical protein [Xanthomonadales bacterium]
MRALLPATLLVSAAAIGYEILLMRLLAIVQWHHFAWMIISLALLGYGASGTAIALARRWLQPRFESAFAICALLFSITMVACFVLGQRVPFNALEVVWDPRQFLHLASLYLLFMLPFFFAASCIGLAFACRSTLIDRIYFFDLAGAGLGALLLTASLFLMLPQKALIGLALLPLAAAWLAGSGRPRSGALAVAEGAWFALLLLLIASEPLELRLSEYKGLRQALQTVGSAVVKERSSPLGLLTVVENPRIPFRHAPGLSLATQRIPPEQLAVFTDGDGMSALNRFAGDFTQLGYLGDVTAALPYSLLHRPRVLVLGAGAGSEVLLALYHNAAQVDAVELDPRMIRLVREDFAGFAGGVYAHEAVKVHISEARSFAARSDGGYDLVQIGLLDSFGVSGSGVQALHENYLYTTEAIGEYLGLLAPGGVLTITRWLQLPPRDSLKLTATLIAALRAAGVAEPGARLALIRNWNTVTLLVKNGDLEPPEIAAIREFARARSFDTDWYPGMPASAANRFNRLDEPYLYDGVAALLGPRAGDFIARYKFHLEPASDDRPYFFHFFKWRVLPEVLALRERGGASLIEWGYPVLIATLAQSVVAGALLILLPLLRVERSWARGTGPRMGSYFFLLGLAFLFIEIAFIQKFILFLGHPLYAVAAVLSGFLVFAGSGSLLSGRWVHWMERLGLAPVRAVAGAIIGMVVLYLLVLPAVFVALSGFAAGMRIAATMLLVAPLAMLMGMPFPLGLERLAQSAPGFIPWAWGINGFASVISAALATLLAIEFGFSAVVLLAAALYALAAALLEQEVSREALRKKQKLLQVPGDCG